MQVSAINSSPNFSSKEMTREDLIKLREIVDGYSQYNLDCDDCFEKQDKKSPVETAIALVGTVLIPLAAGKMIAASAEKLFPKATEKVIDGASKLTQKLGDKVNEIVANEKTKGIVKTGLNYSKEGISKLFNKFIKGETASKTLQNVVGAAAVASITPELATIDGNNDGKKDITQYCISAYDSILKKMHAVKALIDMAV